MAYSNVNTYSPDDVTLIIGGYQAAGWNSISIMRRSNGFVTVAGIRGKHTRVPSGDTSATITLTVIQTSPTNDVLSSVHSMDLIDGAARISLTLKDRSGRSVFSSDEAYIVGYPETTFSGQFEQRVWNIFCQTTGSYTVGGNTRPETSLVDGVIDAISNIF